MKPVKKHIQGIPKEPVKSKDYVIAHEAGNPRNVGPNSLDSEVNYMTNNWRTAFTSDFVGSGGRWIELATPGYIQWGAGPNVNSRAYAHVELARTNNAETFKKDYKTWVNAIRQRAKEGGIPIRFDEPGRGIKSHEWVTKNLGGTTHTDPFGYLASFGISRAQLKKDIENGVGKVSASQPSSKPSSASGASTKGVEKLAREVIDGKWGSGDARKKALGSRYPAVQKRVNQLLSGTSKPKPKKSVEKLAREVIDGKHGSGEARKKALGSQYSAVQKRVNDILSGGTKAKSKKGIETLAREVIAGKHGTGDVRKKSLGSQYAAVQKRVNELTTGKKKSSNKSLKTLVDEV